MDELADPPRAQGREDVRGEPLSHGDPSRPTVKYNNQ